MSEPVKPKINAQTFYFELPLYTLVEYKDIEGNLFSGDVDAWSAENSIDTTYEISNERVVSREKSTFYDFWRVQLVCRRKGEVLRFFVLKGHKWCMKVGQHPSLVDIQFGPISKKYSKVLDNESLFLFKRAVGLAAHGTGAGSFVYLRRIFEKLIRDTYSEHQDALTVTAEDFKGLHMTEKVDALKVFLPPQVVKMKPLYGVLSKGVHELSEEECLAYFGTMKLSIELILDAKIETEAKHAKDRAVEQQLQTVLSKVAQNTDVVSDGDKGTHDE